MVIGNTVERHRSRQFAVADERRHDRLHRGPADDEAEADQRRTQQHRDRRAHPGQLGPEEHPGRDRTGSGHAEHAAEQDLPGRVAGVGPFTAGRAQDQLGGELHDADHADHQGRAGRVVHHDGGDDAVRPDRDDREDLAPEQRAEHGVEHQAQRVARGEPGGGGLGGHRAATVSKRSVSRSRRVTRVSTSESGQSATVLATRSRRLPVTAASSARPASVSTSAHRR